jgi:hypothetical protein
MPKNVGTELRRLTRCQLVELCNQTGLALVLCPNAADVIGGVANVPDVTGDGPWPYGHCGQCCEGGAG